MDCDKDIEILEEFIEQYNASYPKEKEWVAIYPHQIQAIENLIKRNKELEEYANWHIGHLTEDIKDYIDDDKLANANLIGELKEEREHWKDVIRIINNENTYIDYKNY